MPAWLPIRRASLCGWGYHPDWCRQDGLGVRALSGQNGVPILVLDDGEVIAGSGRIKRWADEQDAAPLPPTHKAEDRAGAPSRRSVEAAGIDEDVVDPVVR